MNVVYVLRFVTPHDMWSVIKFVTLNDMCSFTET